jgi:di/tricarboxylate transporter
VNSELIWVLSMLVGAILLFITNKVRMDVVALLIIILFVLSGTLTLPQALAGFIDNLTANLDSRRLRHGSHNRCGIHHHATHSTQTKHYGK